ncbi:MAG: hypothetical protein KME07_16880 [Pegethrix bostrychoides GSE-TBD4-15B]|jgi:hypothetical protein|uniref:CopG family transcriptional regulator n=1 Tax=Pegethrix bostrychoides GSE-TBD4-15B TaxID=2839662 RepID=A0A951U738_9CYAN|nr:hypothetical protein [Pegethrix bostrychoides GSE-TBD4-15B]
MEITIANLSEDDRRKLEFIQQKTDRDFQSSISAAIDTYYQKLNAEPDPLARLKNSPLIGSFQGDPNLSEQSEKIFHSLINNEK